MPRVVDPNSVPPRGRSEERQADAPFAVQVSQPQPGVDPLHRPFVGNETIDDNLGENVRVAIWNVLGERERALKVAVSAGTATLSGPVASPDEAEAVRKAALSIPGISKIVDKLAANRPSRPQSPSRRAAASVATQPTQVIYVTRFCGLDDASTGAAIRQAVGRLDQFFAERKLPTSQKLIVGYRNLIPGALTLEIGFPVPAHGLPRAEGEFHLGELPVVVDQAASSAPGLLPLITTLRDLLGAGHEFAWQEIEENEFRPWRGHPALPLNVTSVG